VGIKVSGIEASTTVPRLVFTVTHCSLWSGRRSCDCDAGRDLIHAVVEADTPRTPWRTIATTVLLSNGYAQMLVAHAAPVA